ncbi:MAG: Ni/Fe hydrogenase subunit gamma [Betaproteobacteria bacterium]|nr:Ni/Fe hydrogenase subunit gamma [Betaproteobacteria bacterium]
MNIGHFMTPDVSRVAGTRRETRDTWTLRLEPPRNAAAWSYRPGQFNMLYAFGIGEVPISISGQVAGDGTLLHTVRAVGRVSAALTRLRKGESVGVRGPFGTPWPMDLAVGRDVIVAAGGLGLAPVRPVVRTLLEQRGKFGRVVLLFGARSPAEIVFRREVERWGRRRDAEVLVTVDHASPDWAGHVGVVTTLVKKAAFDPGNTVAMLCGPEVMMRFMVAALRSSAVPDDAMFLSMERNMKCAIGQCGHCQFGADFVCRDGPVLRYDRVRDRLSVREL